MKVSVQGICSILTHESIILSAYDDGGGVLTIGAGHTAMAGPPTPTGGMKISLEESFNIFRQDLRKYEGEVFQAINVSLSQNQFDALVSWHFNTGRINNSTLTTKLNDGDYAGAAKEFSNWNKSNGKVLRGLVNRRKRETAIFGSADYGDESVIVRVSKGSAAKTIDSVEIVKRMTGAPRNEEDQTTKELLSNPSSRLLPNFRPRQSSETTISALAKFERLVPEGRRGDKVKLLAVRGYYTNSLGKLGQNDRGVYDDAIFVVEPNGVHNFNGNTDPSMFRKGVAKLKAPQAVRYIPGPHGFKRKKGPYPAFRQNSPCTVLRDQDGDDTGIFWINLHRGGLTQTSSAGCQTVPPHQWNEFRTLVKNLLTLHGQSSFYYVLIDVDDVPKSVPAKQVTTQTDQDQISEGKAMPDDRQKELLEVVSIIVQLNERIHRLRESQSAEASNTSSKSGGDPLNGLLQSVVATLGGGLTVVAEPEENPKKLTPINGALGKTIGRALDGRKTGFGIAGLLGTTLLPIFFPQLAPVVAVAKTVAGTVTDFAVASPELTTGQSVLAAAKPLFLSLATWGGFGKVEKWIGELKR